MIQRLRLLFRDLKEWIVLEKYRGTPTSRILFYRLPLKSLQKLYSSISGIINNYLLVNILNSKRFRIFQDSHQDKLGNHFYIIVMPNILHFLTPCIKLIPRTLYRTYRSLKFLEMPANKSLREKNYDQFANLGSSKNLLKLFPDDVNSIQFIHQTDQFMEKLQEHLQE